MPAADWDGQPYLRGMRDRRRCFYQLHLLTLTLTLTLTLSL